VEETQTIRRRGVETQGKVGEGEENGVWEVLGTFDKSWGSGMTQPEGGESGRVKRLHPRPDLENFQLFHTLKVKKSRLTRPWRSPNKMGNLDGPRLLEGRCNSDGKRW